ncbi:MAG: aldehyde ferredoxin oxidoreductase family protein [Syntrophales bacterium]|nr:aldehyde ferredoxin oxidoreductase family protein [Syntrophales bacterium]
MKNGYAGKFLQIDLTEAACSTFTIEEARLKKFIGGSSLAASLYIERFDINADPLSPSNPLMVINGPMVGSGFPGSSRFAVASKSPQTGIWGEAACGGTFGPELKRAGCDGIIITGRSPHPVTLSITDSGVEILSAESLWGRDTYETTDLLKSPDKNIKVLAIGPAGENIVKFSAIANDKGHFVGRTGLGAVMGSKNLKAITARGSRAPEKDDEGKYREVFKRAIAEIKDSAFAESLHLMGSDAAMDLGMMTGDIPIKNWSIGEDFELSASLGGPALREAYLTKAHACSNCPVACKRVVAVKDGPYRTEEGPGPEYETCCSFGTMIMNGDLAAVIKANELCNRYGMDTISAGAAIAVSMELYEKGIISPEAADNLDLSWGNMETVIVLLGRIARREGFGDILARGSLAAAIHFGAAAADCVAHVKGLDLPMHDPRGFHGMGLAYMMSNRGGCHLQHAAMAMEQGMVSWPQLFDMKEDYDGTTSEGKARLVFDSENYGILANSLSMCHYLIYCLKPETVLDSFNAVTGYNFNFNDLLLCGARDWMLKRGINNLLGITVKDDILPKKVLTALHDGAAAGSVPDVKLLRDEYYAIRGLTPQGRVSDEKLLELGLTELKDKLYK